MLARKLKPMLPNKKPRYCTAFLLSLLLFSKTAQACDVPEGFQAESGDQFFVAAESTTIENQESIKPSVTLVNLWAIWCPPCLKELPMLDGIAKDQPYQIQTIHLGDNVAEIDRRFEQLNIRHLPKTTAPMTDLYRYGFQGLPATLVVVDEKIKYRYTGYIKHSAETVQNWLLCLAQDRENNA